MLEEMKKQGQSNEFGKELKDKTDKDKEIYENLDREKSKQKFKSGESDRIENLFERIKSSSISRKKGKKVKLTKRFLQSKFNTKFRSIQKSIYSPKKQSYQIKFSRLSTPLHIRMNNRSRSHSGNSSRLSKNLTQLNRSTYNFNSLDQSGVQSIIASEKSTGLKHKSKAENYNIFKMTHYKKENSSKHNTDSDFFKIKNLRQKKLKISRQQQNEVDEISDFEESQTPREVNETDNLHFKTFKTYHMINKRGKNSRMGDSKDYHNVSLSEKNIGKSVNTSMSNMSNKRLKIIKKNLSRSKKKHESSIRKKKLYANPLRSTNSNLKGAHSFQSIAAQNLAKVSKQLKEKIKSKDLIDKKLRNLKKKQFSKKLLAIQPQASKKDDQDEDEGTTPKFSTLEEDFKEKVNNLNLKK